MNEGNRVMRHVLINTGFTLLTGIFCLVFSVQVSAYSYSAMGDEPVIDGRESMLLAIEKKDVPTMLSALEVFHEELDFLQSKTTGNLSDQFKSAIKKQNYAQLKSLLDLTIYLMIESRLNKAFKDLDNYQVAKVLVMKSKLYLDILFPALERSKKMDALNAMSAILKAVGNPGVFGVGQKSANPEVFKLQQEILFSAIQQFRL